MGRMKSTLLTAALALGLIALVSVTSMARSGDTPDGTAERRGPISISGRAGG